MIKHTFKANRPKIIGDTNMTPYWKTIEKIIEESDLILEVLDARMPLISRNEDLEKLVKQKRKELILILNKSDLVSEKQLRKNFNKLSKLKKVFVISSKDKIGTKRLRDYFFRLSKDYDRLKLGVVGYPNTGKSSMINSLVRRKKVQVTSRAGTTHGVQWVSLNEKINILDSPGIIPLKKDDEIRLALIGSRNVEKIKNLELVAHTIINLFDNKDKLNDFYGVNVKSSDPDEFIEAVGEKKRFLKKGGEVDFSRVSMQIIRDWQIGKLRL